MKYAIISDIHGNLPAFEAVIADAEAQGADMYLLIGDYTNSFPWGNGVADIIRGLKNAVVIRGNGEGYLVDLREKNQTDFSCEQFKPVYWGYKSLSEENLAYMTGLPETAVVSDNGCDIYLNHSMSVFFRSPKIDLFHSRYFRAMMTEAPISHDEYLSRARAALLSRSDAVAEIQSLPKGVHLFGHNHLQFFMEHDGRLFINPGSCGEPLDWNTAAAYTLLTCDDKNRTVTERRVKYDLNATAKKMDASGFAEYAPAWSNVMKMELFSAKDYFMSFVIHLSETARKMDGTEHPVNNEVWDTAVRTWDEEKI